MMLLTKQLLYDQQQYLHQMMTGIRCDFDVNTKSTLNQSVLALFYDTTRLCYFFCYLEMSDIDLKIPLTCGINYILYITVFCFKMHVT